MKFEICIFDRLGFHTFASGGLLVGEGLAMIGHCWDTRRFRPRRGMPILRLIPSGKQRQGLQIAWRWHYSVALTNRAPRSRSTLTRCLMTRTISQKQRDPARCLTCASYRVVFCKSPDRS